jgi:hypothetical protein
MSEIILVKKLLSNGELCAKCVDVEQQLIKNDQMKHIDKVVIADESDSNSEGMVLAKELDVTRAPFFIVDDNGAKQVYVSYLKFSKEVLAGATDKKAELEELVQNSVDLDYI